MRIGRSVVMAMAEVVGVVVVPGTVALVTTANCNNKDLPELSSGHQLSADNLYRSMQHIHAGPCGCHSVQITSPHIALRTQPYSLNQFSLAHALDSKTILRLKLQTKPNSHKLKLTL
ncbi:hypothetical protein J6590_031634 [Homalodisca vitripennis]|nr:hypothetical protein J6590_031634 [Homalodisca vitripennis]